MEHALELVASARINLETVVKQNPAVGKHPIFAMALAQIKEAEQLLGE